MCLGSRIGHYGKRVDILVCAHIARPPVVGEVVKGSSLGTGRSAATAYPGLAQAQDTGEGVQGVLEGGGQCGCGAASVHSGTLTGRAPAHQPPAARCRRKCPGRGRHPPRRLPPLQRAPAVSPAPPLPPNIASGVLCSGLQHRDPLTAALLLIRIPIGRWCA